MKRSKVLIQLVLSAAAVSIVSGCALAPGMYAGGVGEGYEVIARDSRTGKSLRVPVFKMRIQPPAEVEQNFPPQLAFDGYRLGPGDVVNVTVWDHPELTIPAGEFRSAEAAGQLIDSDGTMYYPYCGRFSAAGTTRAELRSRLQSCLSRVIRDPQVDVRVIQFFSQRVSVGGAVNQPGVISLRNTPIHVSDAIALAGGLNEMADTRHVSLSRDDATYQIDFKRYTESGDARLNPLLKAGDTLHIGSSADRRVNVLGEVRRPTTVGLSDSVRTLADALGAANGLTPESSQPERILVMRSQGGRPAVHWLDGDDPLQLLVAQSFELQPGDVVYVDQTGIIRWGRVVSQLLPFFGIVSSSATAANAGN